MPSLRCSIKRAELTAFLCLFRKAVGPPVVHENNKGISDGLWSGEMRCIGPRAKDADLWILISEESHRVHQEGVLVEVERVNSPRSKKEMQPMSLLEKANERAKEGTRLDGGEMAQVRAITIQEESTEVSAALPYAASFHCLVEEWKDCEELQPKPKRKTCFL